VQRGGPSGEENRAAKRFEFAQTSIHHEYSSHEYSLVNTRVLS